MRPWGTLRNWDSYGHKLNIENEKQRHILCDPQTSGGLLIAVKKEAAQKVESILKSKALCWTNRRINRAVRIASIY
jgi:selenide,water dikinase